MKLSKIAATFLGAVTISIVASRPLLADPAEAIADAGNLDDAAFEDLIEDLQNAPVQADPASGRQYLYDGRQGDINDLNAYLQSMRAQGKDVAVYVDGNYIGTAGATGPGGAPASGGSDTGEAETAAYDSDAGSSGSGTDADDQTSTPPTEETPAIRRPRRSNSSSSPPDTVVVDATEAVRLANSRKRGSFLSGAYFSYLRNLGTKLGDEASRKYSTTDARIGTQIPGDSAADQRFRDEVASMFCPGQKC